MGVRLVSRNTPVGSPLASLTTVMLRGARLLLVTPINRSAAVFATEGNGGVLHQPHTLRMNTGLFGATASRSWRRRESAVFELLRIVEISQRRVTEWREHNPFTGRRLPGGAR